MPVVRRLDFYEISCVDLPFHRAFKHIDVSIGADHHGLFGRRVPHVAQPWLCVREVSHSLVKPSPAFALSYRLCLCCSSN